MVTVVRGYTCAHFQLTKLINACDVANLANESNIIQTYEFPRGLCAAHTEISPINVSLHFQEDSQTRLRGNALLKELSGMATTGGVGRERQRQRISRSVRALQGVLECE